MVFLFLLCIRHVYLICHRKEWKLGRASEKSWKQLVLLFYCDLIAVTFKLTKKTWMLEEGFVATFERENDCVRMDMMI